MCRLQQSLHACSSSNTHPEQAWHLPHPRPTCSSVLASSWLVSRVRRLLATAMRSGSLAVTSASDCKGRSRMGGGGWAHERGPRFGWVPTGGRRSHTGPPEPHPFTRWQPYNGAGTAITAPPALPPRCPTCARPVTMRCAERRSASLSGSRAWSFSTSSCGTDGWAQGCALGCDGGRKGRVVGGERGQAAKSRMLSGFAASLPGAEPTCQARLCPLLPSANPRRPTLRAAPCLMQGGSPPAWSCRRW